MLHGKAGSQVVYEIHGHFRRATCLGCYREYDAAPFLEDFVITGNLPYCNICGGILKPNVILIGEQLPITILNEAKRQAFSCDLMLVVGSSLEMAPACDIPAWALSNGARLVIINLEPTHMDHLAEVTIHARIEEVLPKLAASFVQRA